MSVNAIVAVHPDIDIQFDDAQVLGQLPIQTQEVITKAKDDKNNFKSLTVNVSQYIVYSVYGSTNDLENAIAHFGSENIIPMGSWNIDGSRYGTYISKTVENGTLPATITIPVEDISPSIITTKRWVHESTMLDDGEGGQVPSYQKVLKTFHNVRGEIRDSEDNVIDPGYVDITYNGTVVLQVHNNDLNPDGTYTYQPPFDQITTETVEGIPSIPLHAELLSIMPDDVTYDSNGDEISRAPSASLKQVVLKAGQKPRVFT